MRIRKITPTDRDAVCGMMAAFYRSDAVSHAIPDIHFSRTMTLLFTGTPFADCFVLEEEAALIGYVLLAHTWSNEGGGMVVWIEELYLAAQCRGKGYGRQTMAFLHEAYHDASRFRLEITPDNQRAARLYQMMGYEYLSYQQMLHEG